MKGRGRDKLLVRGKKNHAWMSSAAPEAAVERLRAHPPITNNSTPQPPNPVASGLRSFSGWIAGELVTSGPHRQQDPARSWAVVFRCGGRVDTSSPSTEPPGRVDGGARGVGDGTGQHLGYEIPRGRPGITGGFPGGRPPGWFAFVEIKRGRRIRPTAAEFAPWGARRRERASVADGRFLEWLRQCEGGPEIRRPALGCRWRSLRLRATEACRRKVSVQ